jgi:ABC-type microcin C transport system permease subunit YejB
MSDLPRTYVAGRLLIVVPTLLIVVLICAGFAGWGPGGPLRAAATEPAIQWVTGHEPHGDGQAALRRRRRQEHHRRQQAERRKKKHERHAKHHGRPKHHKKGRTR